MGWLIASFILLRGDARAQLTSRAIALGTALLTALSLMGPTRHNNVNGAYGEVLMRLGYQEHASLEVWMNTCDPQWRSVVYHGSAGERP